MQDFLVKITVPAVKKNPHDFVDSALDSSGLTYSYDEVDGNDVYLIVTIETKEGESSVEYLENVLNTAKVNWCIVDCLDDDIYDIYDPSAEFINEDGCL